MEDKDALYAKWLNGEIDDDELRSVVGPEEFAELDRVVKTVDQWSMPKYDTSEGYAKFKQKHRIKPAEIRKINWFKIGGIAASFLILFFVGNHFYSNQDEQLFAANGLNENAVLADGSEIWVNDGSSVTYTSKNWSDQRTIELTGEALFEVTKGSPFTVKTQNGSIRVLGTQFNVRAWGSNLFVECYEGKVEVTVGDQKTILTANEAVDVFQGSMNEKQNISNSSPSWQIGVSKFQNEKLYDIFEELERQYDIEVKMPPGNRSFSGQFKHDDLEKALQGICKPLGLKYNIDEDQKIVVIEE